MTEFSFLGELSLPCLCALCIVTFLLFMIIFCTVLFYFAQFYPTQFCFVTEAH